MSKVKPLIAIASSLFVSTQMGFAFAATEQATAAEAEPQPDQVGIEQRRAFFDDKKRGWFFYEEGKKQVKPKPAPEQKPPQPQLTPLEVLKKQGQDHENAAAAAILNPTPENYRNYLQQTVKILDQSQRFAEGLRNYTYVTPELDYTLQHPQGRAAQVQNTVASENKYSVLAATAQQNAIMFFFRSDCPYCHKFAPILQNFAAQFGFMVVPVSLDGRGLPEYPNPRTNPALVQKLQVSAVPAVYLLNPRQNRVSTVGFGLTDSETLGDKIIAALTRKQ